MTSLTTVNRPRVILEVVAVGVVRVLPLVPEADPLNVKGLVAPVALAT